MNQERVNDFVVNDERSIQEALATLQLPHMPRGSVGASTVHTSSTTSTRRRRSNDRILQSSLPQAGFQTIPLSIGRRSQKEQQQQHHPLTPTITILVCADIDLKSTSALAEYTLQQQHLFQQQKGKINGKHPQHHFHFDYNSSAARNQSSRRESDKQSGFDSKAIDFIIAAGPCARDEDLISSYRGRQKHRVSAMRHSTGSVSQHGQNSPMYVESNINSDEIDAAVEVLGPFLRSREKSSALEGLLTAALSQLESIVCRVVYCPGFQDPTTTILPTIRHTEHEYNVSERQSYQRLTPNSRNINQQWLPLARGLGCAALFYLDGTETLINACAVHDSDGNSSQSISHLSSEHRNSITNHSQNPSEGTHDYLHNHDDNDEEVDDRSRELRSARMFLDQLSKVQKGYYATLHSLLQLAPRPVPPIAKLSTSQHEHQQLQTLGQSILVTHYVNSHTLLHRERLNRQREVAENLMDDKYHQQETNNNEGCNGAYQSQFSSGTEVSSPCDQEAFARPNSDADDEMHIEQRKETRQSGDSKQPNSTQRSKESKTEVSDNLPWPSGHDKFLTTDSVRQNLCLEIASGYAAEHEATWIDVHRNIKNARGVLSSRKKLKHPLKDCPGRTLLPGSLRKRGEFCILELALIDQQWHEKTTAPKQHHHSSSVPKADHRRFAWEVQAVKFHRMD